MSTETPAAAGRHSPGDARALQMRLYRELGLAAVTAALDTSAPIDDAVRMMPLRQTSATPTSQERAA